MTEKKDLRPLATGLCAAAAACLLYAAFTNAWLANSNRYTEIGFGLRKNFECGVSYSFDGAEEQSKQACEWHTNAEVIAKWRDMGEEATYSHTFTAKGTYKYVCKYHAAMGMVGTVIVA